MKIIKNIFVGLLILLAIARIPITDSYEELLWFITAFLLMLLLSILNYRESFDLLKNIFIFNIRLSKGFPYCCAGFLHLIDLLKKSPSILYEPYLNWQIVLCFMAILLAIFNYGIEVRKEDS